MTTVGSLEDQELMPEGEDLDLQRGLSSEGLQNREEQRQNDREYGIGKL